MADPTTPSAPVEVARASELGPIGRFLKATELDTRMLGMVAALVLFWVVLHFLSGGLFLTPRNLWNLSVQSSSVAIMATGMVVVIVWRNIDRSVGTLLGFLAMIMGAVQTQILPVYLGYDNPFTWIITLGAGLVVGGLIGAFQGFIIAYLGVPPSS